MITRIKSLFGVLPSPSYTRLEDEGRKSPKSPLPKSPRSPIVVATKIPSNGAPFADSFVIVTKA